MIKTLKKIWSNCANRHKPLVVSLIFSLLKSVLGITQLFAIITAVNVLLGKTDVKSGVILIAILTVVCILGNFLTSFSEQINILKTGFFMVADKRTSLGNKLRKFPLGFFNNSSRTKTIATLTTTMSGMETASVMVMIGIISGLLNSITIFVFMMFYDYKIGLIAGLGMVLYMIVVGYQMKQSRQNAPKLQQAQDNLSRQTLTFLQGIKVIKSYSFKQGDTNLKQAIIDSKDANINLTNKSMLGFYMSGIVIAVFESIMLVITLLMYFSWNQIDIIKTIILIIFSFMVYASLNQAGSMLSMIGLLDSGLDEIANIENQQELTNNQPIQNAKSNEITFNNVSFAYEDNEVLHDVSFQVKPKTFTALVGPSGSGKTTICELIPRFRDVASGEILIGGANVKNMPYEEICKNISMVFQRVYLFEDTILNNVRFGNPNASDEQVKQACKKAMCDEFISKLPDGYNTMVQEGGSNLSGGEKQRLSIARAIVKDSPIILLDEATASVDPENEYEIKKAIGELTKDKTVLMIAHKLSTIKNADQIIVINKGKIVQKGTHEELSKQHGLYEDFILARQQASKFEL